MKRYEFDDQGYSHERKDGEWVKYDDHKEELITLRNIITEDFLYRLSNKLIALNKKEL